MLENNIPFVEEEDLKTLGRFMNGSSNEAAALKRVMTTSLEHFRDIRNVDPKLDSVGLQACSHIRAYDMLEQIFSQIQTGERSEPKKNKSFR